MLDRDRIEKLIEALESPEFVRAMLWTRNNALRAINSEYMREDPSSSFIKRNNDEVEAIEKVIALLPREKRTPPAYKY